MENATSDNFFSPEDELLLKVLIERIIDKSVDRAVLISRLFLLIETAATSYCSDHFMDRPIIRSDLIREVVSEYLVAVSLL